MGWEAYDQPNPIHTKEMTTLTEYLEADVKGLWQMLKWLRESVDDQPRLTRSVRGWYALS